MYRKSAGMVLVLFVGGGLLAAWSLGWFGKGPERNGPHLIPPDETYSNIRPEDYVGPKACSHCHEKQYQGWSKHPHRFMNQLASATSIKGDFNNYVWQARTSTTVSFTTQGKDYLMTVRKTGAQRTQYKVTRTVGSRFMQLYVGVQTEGMEPAGDRVYTQEHKLPFGYWFRMKRWLPLDYFDIADEYTENLQDGIPVEEGVDTKAHFLSYNDTCVHCHNTYPHAYRIFNKYLAGYPDARIEPDLVPLSAALAPRIVVEPTAAAFSSLPFSMDPKKDLVTVGISCESCHLGGREHVVNAKAISFAPTNPNVTVTSRSADKPFTGNRYNPATSQGTCAQCHSATSIGQYPNGTRIRNSSESSDMAAGACTTQIRCVTCHEPHTPSQPSGGPTPASHLAACVKCHPQYAAKEKAVAHSRHPASVDCMDCHMLRISQGVDEMTHTHRISQPVEQSMVSAAAPNACNLCHLDRSTRWTLAELKRGWGRDIQPLPTTPAGSLDQPAGKVWLKSEHGGTRLAVLGAFTRSPLWKANLPDVLAALNDGNPTNRSFALFGVERILGRQLTVAEIDIAAPPARRLQQIEALRARMEK